MTPQATTTPQPTTRPSRRRLRTILLVVLTAAVAGPVGALVGGRLAGPRGSAPAQVAAPVEQYQCPMHPAIIQDHPGTCPICGMKLVKVAGGAARPPERQPRFYRSPMDPRQTSPVPAKDAMGMDYLPVYEDDAPGRSEVDGLAVVEIDSSRQQLIGLTTARVDRGRVGGAFKTVGRVSVDETQVRRVSVRVQGFVERVFVDFVGKPVRKGQPLFSMYSPEVLAAERELLLALKGRGSGEPGGGPLAAAARRKLELWGVPESEVRRLEAGGEEARAVTFLSPVAGVVTRKDVVEGASLPVGAMPYEIVDLSSVWLLADVYEPELRFVPVGVPATLRLSAWPGRAWSGQVLFVDPVLDPKTRTARARLAFPNPGGELKPEMFGEVVLERPARDALRVPANALIRSGAEDVVFVARGEGRFEPRRVQLGEVGRDFAEVVAGLAEGEAVVTRANFLVDSESRLRASLDRLGAGAPPAPHEGHEAPP